MAEGGVPDVETQKNEISSLINTPLKKGDIWYEMRKSFPHVSP